MSNSIEIKRNSTNSSSKQLIQKVENKLNESFRNYRNVTVTLARISKKKDYKLFFEDNKKDSKKVWECIQLLIDVKNKRPSHNISVNIDNETKADDLTISSHFNNFFTSVAIILVTKIPKTAKFFDSHLKYSNENSFFYPPQQRKTLKKS